LKDFLIIYSEITDRNRSLQRKIHEYYTSGCIIISLFFSEEFQRKYAGTIVIYAKKYMSTQKFLILINLGLAEFFQFHQSKYTKYKKIYLF
jgi:hypothetical protein